MTMAKSIRLRGLKNLINHFRKSAELTEVKDVLKGNGEQMFQSAQKNVPVDTGKLRDSIRLNIDEGGFNVNIKSDADHASYVEYGTRHQHAQPFVGPAFKKQQKKFKEDLNKLTK